MASPATLSTGDDQRFHGGGPFATASQAVPYSPLATPSRSSMRPKEGTVRRAGSVAASVRFSGVHYQEIAADPTDHLEGVGPMRGRSPQGVKKNIFKKYFDEFNTYALMVSPVSPSRAPPAFRSGGGGSVASAPATPTSRRSLGGGAGAGLIVRAGSIARGGGGGAVGEWDAPWTPISAAGVSTTHVPSEWDSPRPRWAVGRRKGMGAAGGAAEPGDGPLHAATRPVTCGGPLPSHVAALDELLAKSWSRAEVEAAQSWGFFRRLVPHLGVPPLQAPTALLLGRCARLQPGLLPPLTAELCGALPVLMASPRLDVRQASLCLLGLLWRATAAGDSHARAHLLNSSALLTALTTRVAEGDFDAMFAAREVAADQRGAVALEKAGALRAVCGALRKLVAAARAAAGEAEGEGAAGTDGEEEPGGAAARAAGAGPAKSPAAKSPAAKSPGKKQLALAGAGKGAGGGVRAPPGLTGRSPSPSKKAVVVSVEGVTEGGEETERAAAGVLVADCLAALTAALPAASAMVRRYRVPERLVALLLTCRVEPDPDPEKEKGKEQDEQKADTDKGKDQDQERGSAAAGGGGGEAGAAAAGAQQGVNKATSESGSDIDIDKILNEDSSDEKRELEKGKDEAKKEGSSGGAQSEQAPEDAAAAAGGDAEKEKGKEEEEAKEEGGDEAAKRMSEGRRRQLQLQEALLRCLHTLAACGMGKEPQEAVQRALRDAGAPAMERLARVLQEHHTLAGCSSAAYLLWLAAAGDYSATPAAELNVLRSRLAAEAPKQPEDRSSTSGFGVVGAVRELLLRHVAVAAVAGGGAGGGWRDEDLGDAVAEVGTAVPPPPPPPPPAAAAVVTPRGAGASRLGGGGSSGSGGDSEGRLRRSMGPGASGAAPSLHTDSLPRPQDLVPGDSPFTSRGAASSGGGAGGEIGGGGSRREVTGPSLGLAALRVASAALMLTPRESRPGSGGHMISPQRYAAGSSDEEDEEGGGGRGRAAGFAGGRPRGGSGGGDDQDGGSSLGGGRGGGGGSASTPPEDMDLSNIIDSSVELTGKEYIMQAIQAAGALAAQEVGGLSGPGPSPDPRISGGAGTIAPMPSPGEPFPPAGIFGDAHGMGSRGRGGAGGAEAHATGAGHGSAEQGGYGREGLPAAPGSGSTPIGAPRSSRTPDSHLLQQQQQQRHVGWAPSGGRLDALRPAALELALAASSPLGAGGGAAGAAGASGSAVMMLPGRGAAKRIPLLTLKTRLGALRAVRQQRRPRRPPPSEFQELLRNCFGLLSAVALSSSGCRAICEVPRPAAGEGGAEGGAEAVGGILPFAAALLETAADAPESLAAAAVSGSSTELRLQLFALMGNIALHSDGVEALTSEAAGAPPGLVAALFAAARESLALVGSSPTGWREGQRLLEACFTVLTNLHRGRATLSPPPDPATGRPQEAYALALRALAMQLPGAMGAADRVRVRAAAARMLDSAIAAYEGVGGSAPPAVAEELMALVAAGGGIATASAGASITAADGSSSGSGSAGAGARAFGPGAGKGDAEGGGGGGGAGGPRVTEAAERAACDAAAALWQLLAAGQVHPDAAASVLTPALSAILRRTDATAALTKGALGLVSCLARSPLVARRLWTTPLVPAVMKAHARARKAGEGEVEEAARGVCQQLLRACHREDRGSVSDADRRVDRWGLTERMLSQLKCRLEWDGGEEAIMLVDWDAD